MTDWIYRIPDWVVWAWVGMGVFLSSQIEPMPGVWVAAFFGAALSGMTGRDKSFSALLVHVTSCVAVGVFASQIVAELIVLRVSLSRVGFAFFLAFFAEKVLAGISSGAILSAFLKLKGNSK